MKFYDSFGMNPRTIRFYLIEKGIDLPRQEVNILAAENHEPEYLDLNPAGQTPALALDDGSIISETVAIMEYLEEKHPTPALIGGTAEERAIPGCGGAEPRLNSVIRWSRASTTRKAWTFSRPGPVVCRRRQLG